MSQSKGKATARRTERQSRQRAGPAQEVPSPAHPQAEAHSAPASEGASALPDNAYRVHLPAFEGPLDLLLHLIQQHELDIFDIPVSFVTEKYLDYLQMMRSLSIDVASEYLVMAATLAHIKSKMLLPSIPKGQEDDGVPEEEEDPRAELVRRLLEYQKYRAAAADLSERGTLGRDVFGRGTSDPVPEGPAPFASLGVFSLLDAFEKILKRTNIRLDHEVIFDRISITDRIVEITEKLMHRRSMRFEDLLIDPKENAAPSRFDIVITFLALLEMCRLRVIRVYQSDPLAPLHLELAVQDQAAAGPATDTTDDHRTSSADDATAAPPPAPVEEAFHGEEASAHSAAMAEELLAAQEPAQEPAPAELPVPAQEPAPTEEAIATADGAHDDHAVGERFTER